MHISSALINKARYWASVSSIYALTIMMGWFAVYHPATPPRAITLVRAVQRPSTQLLPQVPLISGQPDQIVIPASGINLTVNPGDFDSNQSTWTLSGYDAQYATFSAPANNTSGETFIYGHNNDYVFGALRHETPELGAQALIYTTNGHIFSYSFQYSYSLAPDDTSVLSYNGPPILLVQTCTGSLNEWRTMYLFDFTKVVQ